MRGYSPEKQRTRWGDSTISQVPGTQSRGIKEPPASRKPPGGRLSTGAWGAPCSTLRHRWWQLRAKLFIGSTRTISSTTHFGKVTRPDGVMLQLGQCSSERDVWLWVPSGTSHQPAQPLELTPDPEPLAGVQRAAFHQQLAPGWDATGLRFGGLHSPLPARECVGARQHPQQGPLLSSSGGGGEAVSRGQSDLAMGCSGQEASNSHLIR
jgi:hypothetical protein